MTHFSHDYEQGLKDAEARFWKAIDLNHTSNDIGEYIYLNDLKDALKELDETEANKVA